MHIQEYCKNKSIINGLFSLTIWIVFPSKLFALTRCKTTQCLLVDSDRCSGPSCNLVDCKLIVRNVTCRRCAVNCQRRVCAVLSNNLGVSRFFYERNYIIS